MFVCNKCNAIYTKNDDGVLIPYSYRHCHHAQSCGECTNNIIELDDEAVPMVIGLWEKGYRTMFSCSGHPITRESVAAHDFTMDTYVLIDTTNLKQDFIDHIVNDIYSKKKYNLVVVKATESILNNIETKCLHSGWKPKKGEPRMMPIYQSTTFKYDTSEEMGRLFDLKDEGYFYTRLQNPTNDMVAEKITDLEGGVAGVLTSSGQAANFYAVFNICEAGDHVICASAIYGGTLNLLGVTAKKMGIECTFIDADAPAEELEKAFQPNTKAVFAETISNPALVVLDIEKMAKLAHEHGVPLIVDNTFATPVNCKPFEWGADIVTHSTTKYMDGHAMQVGGAIIDSGKFDWDAYGEKFHGLTRPDESYHGIVYTEHFGKSAYIAKINAQLMRDLGSIPSPMNCFLLNASLESLPLRVERHCYNAQKVAEFLDAHELVGHVNYAGLPNDKYHELAKKYMPNGTCGVISFELKAGREAAVKFMDSLKLASIVTHVADAKTSVLHPASHTHRQLNDEQLKAAGISPGLIRLSVGIENVEDIIDDLAQALEESKKL